MKPYWVILGPFGQVGDDQGVRTVTLDGAKDKAIYYVVFR